MCATSLLRCRLCCGVAACIFDFMNNFRKGMKLGKEEQQTTGLAEPLSIVLKRGRTGLGVEESKRRKKVRGTLFISLLSLFLSIAAHYFTCRMFLKTIAGVGRDSIQKSSHGVTQHQRIQISHEQQIYRKKTSRYNTEGTTPVSTVR